MHLTLNRYKHMLVQHLVGFSLSIHSFLGSSLSSLILLQSVSTTNCFTYFSRQTAALPSYFSRLSAPSNQHTRCMRRLWRRRRRPCVLIRWAFPFFCFVLIPIQSNPKAFLRKQHEGRKLILNTFFSHANLRRCGYRIMTSLRRHFGVACALPTLCMGCALFLLFSSQLYQHVRDLFTFSAHLVFLFFSLFCKLFCVYNKCIIL